MAYLIAIMMLKVRVALKHETGSINLAGKRVFVVQLLTKSLVSLVTRRGTVVGCHSVIDS